MRGTYLHHNTRPGVSGVVLQTNVTCHMLRDTCHTFSFISFLDKGMKLVGEGSVINGAYPV